MRQLRDTHTPVLLTTDYTVATCEYIVDEARDTPIIPVLLTIDCTVAIFEYMFVIQGIPPQPSTADY